MQYECLFIVGARGSKHSLLSLNHSELVVRDRVPRIQLDRTSQAGFSFLQITGAPVSDAEVDVCRCDAWCCLRHLHERRDALFILLLFQQAYCAVVVGSNSGIDVHFLHDRESAGILLDLDARRWPLGALLAGAWLRW